MLTEDDMPAHCRLAKRLGYDKPSTAREADWTDVAIRGHDKGFVAGFLTSAAVSLLMFCVVVLVKYWTE